METRGYASASRASLGDPQVAHGEQQDGPGNDTVARTATEQIVSEMCGSKPLKPHSKLTRNSMWEIPRRLLIRYFC